MNMLKKIILLIAMFRFLFPCEGDANLDELINVQDVVTMVNIVLGPIDDLYDYLCVADLNQDDTINVQDIILLVNLILG